MKSSGKTLPSKKKQEEILQFFLTNIKSVELGNLLARELKRKRKGLPIRSGLKTAPVDLSHFYVYSNSFESMVNHLAHVPPFSSIFPDARIMAPLLTTGCAQAADNSAQNAYPLLNQWISFALVHMYHSHFGFPLEIFQHIARRRPSSNGIPCLMNVGHTGRKLEEAFDAFKGASLADLNQYESVSKKVLCEPGTESGRVRWSVGSCPR